MSIETADDLDWMADAACREYPPEMWFPEQGSQGGAARRICAGCPAKAQCLLFALETAPEFGIFGGLGPRSRERLSPRPGARQRPPCGTPAGYRAHYRRTEKPCEPCRAAEMLYKAERRAAA